MKIKQLELLGEVEELVVLLLMVPEGYLEAVRLDWEDEEEGLEVAEDRWDGYGDTVVVKSGDA
jgi:hypothetical protein